MEVQVNTLAPQLFLELYTSVGREAPCIAQVKKALENTIVAFTAYDNGQTVGMVLECSKWFVQNRFKERS